MFNALACVGLDERRMDKNSCSRAIASGANFLIT
jgi:hypothetical protein